MISYTKVAECFLTSYPQDWSQGYGTPLRLGMLLWPQDLDTVRTRDRGSVLTAEQGSNLKMKSSCFWRLRTRNLVANRQVLVAICYVSPAKLCHFWTNSENVHVVNFELVTNLLTAWKLLVASRTILVALATVSVAIFEPCWFTSENGAVVSDVQHLLYVRTPGEFHSSAPFPSLFMFSQFHSARCGHSIRHFPTSLANLRRQTQTASISPNLALANVYARSEEQCEFFFWIFERANTRRNNSTVTVAQLVQGVLSNRSAGSPIPGRVCCVISQSSLISSP